MTPNSELKEELIENNLQKGVILYLKFLLHFWSYNNSLKITVWVFYLREASNTSLKGYEGRL